MNETPRRPRFRRLRKFLKIYLWVSLVLLVLTVIADRIWFQGSGHPPPHLKIPGLFSQGSPLPGTYALLVNGAIRPKKNHPRYWNNISLMFGTLKHMGFESIQVLNSDGTSPSPDRLQRAFLAFFPYGETEDSPQDLDGDGRPDISGPATRKQLALALRSIGEQIPPEGRLFLFFTDHGKLRFRRGRFYAVVRLWGEEISGEELNRLLLETLPPEIWVTILAAQCWSVEFLKRIDRPRTILMAPGRPNWIWSDHDYSIFPYLFCEALLQRSPKTGTAKPGDPNLDGFVSFQEAFELARKRDHAPEWPIMWIVGDGSPVPPPF